MFYKASSFLKYSGHVNTWGHIVINLEKEQDAYCRQQKDPTILISRLLLCMRSTYVAGIRLDFH